MLLAIWAQSVLCPLYCCCFFSAHTTLLLFAHSSFSFASISKLKHTGQYFKAILLSIRKLQTLQISACVILLSSPSFQIYSAGISPDKHEFLFVILIGAQYGLVCLPPLRPQSNYHKKRLFSLLHFI